MAKKKTLSSAPDQSTKSDSSEPAKPPVDFEVSLGEIEQIVRDLENGNLTLDDSLKQYEHAVGKMRQCYRLLEVAERKISVLAGFDADGNPVTKPMDDLDSVGDVETVGLLEKQKNRGRRRGAGTTDLSSTSTSGDSGEIFE